MVEGARVLAGGGGRMGTKVLNQARAEAGRRRVLMDWLVLVSFFGGA
jgi:hypothetical protein